MFTQGMVVHETYRKADGSWAAPNEIRIEGMGAQRSASLLATGEAVEIGSIEKMSKSKRNTVDPDDIIGSYGADTARWFMLSDSPPDRDVIWSEEGVQGASRFVQRIWRLVTTAAPHLPPPATAAADGGSESSLALRRAAHRTLADVSGAIERLRFNTAIAKLYTFVSALAEVVDDPARRLTADPATGAAAREAFGILIRLISSMMPQLAEECWQALGYQGLVSEAAWPEADAALLVDETITLPVQVNGKKRADVTVGRQCAEPRN